MTDPRLMIPGPVEAEDDVLAALGSQTMPHYGAAFMQLFNETTTRLKRLFETEGDALMVPGPGTGALESAISSLVPRGQSLVALDNGFFGARMIQVVEACGIRPWVITEPMGKPVMPETLRARLSEWLPQAEAEGAPIRAVAMVHHETSTGVLNPIEGLAAVAREFDLAVIVDAVASGGGVRIPVDEWGLDICVTVPNKCIGAPPAMGLMAVSERAWQMAAANDTPHGWFLNLNTWRWYMDNWGDWHPYPTTMPTNNIAALNVALADILAEGAEAHYARFREAAATVREGLAPLGFRLVPDEAYAAPMVSALYVPEGVRPAALQKYLLTEHDMMISGGLGALKGQIVRIGHMGRANAPEAVEALVSAVQAFVGEASPA